MVRSGAGRKDEKLNVEGLWDTSGCAETGITTVVVFCPNTGGESARTVRGRATDVQVIIWRQDGAARDSRSRGLSVERF
jgi:hypothetical protein